MHRHLYGLWLKVLTIPEGIQIKEDQERQMGHYCLTSIVMLVLTTANRASGLFSLSFSLVIKYLFWILMLVVKICSINIWDLLWLFRQCALFIITLKYKCMLVIGLLQKMEWDLLLIPRHLNNIGRLIEEMESKLSKLCNGLNEVVKYVHQVCCFGSMPIQISSACFYITTCYIL